MANEANIADHLRTTRKRARFDFASRLPRKASLSDPRQCSIYFLAGGGLIKIGITTNLTSRIRAIRNSSPIPLELLATMPGATLEEGRLHSKFRHLREHGEWFRDEGEIREHVGLLIANRVAERRTFDPCLNGGSRRAAGAT